MDNVRKYIQEAEEWYEYYPFYFHSSILKYIQAEYAKRIGDDELAIKLYNELTINTSSANVYNRYLKMKNSLAQLYTKQNRPREACAIFQDINIARDSINARNYSTQINLLRTIYQVDRLEMDNQSERSRLLFYSIIGCILILGISIVSVLYIRKINARLIASQYKLEKARQSAENSIRTKSLFLSNMSHEIRTPLNALSGFSEVLTTPGIDEDTRKQCYEIIQLNSRLLINLLNDVVDISCLDVKNMKFDLKVCDAVPLCEGIIQTVEGIKQTQAALSFETTLPSLEIETDIFRLPQVLINILVNATKFTKEGSIILRLEQNEEGMAQFSVTDTGCGIPLEKQPTIFNRFERVDEKSQGTGIGLSICQFIIDQLGGNIWIDPEYTNGSRFIFTHPLKQAGKA